MKIYIYNIFEISEKFSSNRIKDFYCKRKFLKGAMEITKYISY